MYRTIRAPLSVQVEITDNCNEACTHCYRSCQLSQKTPTKAMTPEDALSVVDELSRADVFAVTFTGGEPLLYQKTLLPAIERVRSHGMTCNVNTNLQPVNDEVIRVCATNDVRILTSIASLDADVHDVIVGLKGSHERLMRNMDRMISAGVKVSANMVVRKENAYQVYEVGKQMHRMGVRKFSATKAAPTPGTPYELYQPSHEQIRQSLDDLLRLHNDFGLHVDILESYPLCFFKDLEKYKRFARRNCTAGVFNCSVSPDGTIRPCSHADMTYGHVIRDGLSTCWANMSDWREGTYINKECQECPYVYECTGGCRIDAKTIEGDIYGKDPLMGDWREILPIEDEPEEMDIPIELRLDSRTGFRNEDFGGILKLNDEIVFLTQSGVKAVDRLRGTSINLEDHSCSNDELSLFGLLYQKGILVA